MAAGVAVVSAIPLAAATVVGGITWGVNNLFPGELVVRSIDYKSID
jgi:membrane protein DedA with SNARE-associated domain